MFLKDLNIANEMYESLVEFDEELAIESERSLSGDFDDDDMSIALTQEDEEDILNDIDDDDLDDDYDDFDDIGMESFLNDLDDMLAMEGIFRSKENVEKSSNMTVKEMLPYFVAHKSVRSFGKDTEKLKDSLKSLARDISIGKTSIVHIEGIPFAVSEFGAYYLMSNGKITDVTLSKLKSISARVLTKQDRAKNGIFGNKNRED